MKLRYVELKLKLPTIVELGCKTDHNYEKVLNALDTIEKELIRIPIVDANGSRSG